MKRRVSETKLLVATAAVECFENEASTQISMSEIAARAGVSRQALYRAFETRSDLIQHILNDRFTKIGEMLRPYFESASSLEEALIEGCIRAVSAGRNDKVIQLILDMYSDHTVEQFIFQGSDEILQLTRTLWGPLIQRARKKSLIDPTVSDDRILDWIQQVEAVLSLRDDWDEGKQRALLRDFLVPSIIRRDWSVR